MGFGHACERRPAALASPECVVIGLDVAMARFKLRSRCRITKVWVNEDSARKHTYSRSHRLGPLGACSFGCSSGKSVGITVGSSGETLDTIRSLVSDGVFES